MNSNLNAFQEIASPFVHPWYIQQQLLANTTTSDVESTPKPLKETTGQKHTRECSICKTDKSLSEFPNHKRDHQHGKDTRCRDCLKKYNRGKSIAKKNATPKPERCECCNTKTSKLCLDHCHDTFEFRGWLCMNCNTGIGRLGDNLEGLQKAINYLSTT